MMRRSRGGACVAWFLTAAFVSSTASLRADNVDLSTVPDRDTVQLTIYNSEDLTLVRETRKITFHQGVNPLQFSWANTLIDPTSVELKFRTQADQLELLDTTAELARIPVVEVGQLGKDAERQYKTRALRLAFSRGGSAELADGDSSEKEIIKEGLSEYFIFTIEGTETVAHGWSKRMRSLKPVDVPLKIQYRYREVEYGPQLVRLYLARNDFESRLGTTPLPDGTVRVFRDNGRDGLSFLVAQPIQYIPIGDKIELVLGVDPEVGFELKKGRVWRTHLWMQGEGVDVLRRVNDGKIAVEFHGSIVGWDDHTYYIQHVRNSTGKPIELELRRVFPGHIVFRNGLGAVRHDYQTVQITAIVAAGQRAQLRYEVIQHMGSNEKQANVEIVDVR
jgi:hypothetical protein